MPLSFTAVKMIVKITPDHRTYSEMLEYKTYEDRLDYLRLPGTIGAETFGSDRYLNQTFYRSAEWRSIRSEVIARDLGCDLAVEGYDIHGDLLVHHINPITVDHIRAGSELLIDPDNLVTTTMDTHNAIHFGHSTPQIAVVTRTPHDTKIW